MQGCAGPNELRLVLVFRWRVHGAGATLQSVDPVTVEHVILAYGTSCSQLAYRPETSVLPGFYACQRKLQEPACLRIVGVLFPVVTSEGHAVCQAVGMLAFGPETCTVCSGLVYSQTKIEQHPYLVYTQHGSR